MRLNIQRNPYTTFIAILLSASIIVSLFTGSVVYVAVATLLCGIVYVYSVMLLHRLETFRQALQALPITKDQQKDLELSFALRDWMTLFIKLSRIRRKQDEDREAIEHAIRLARIEIRRPNPFKSFVKKLRSNP